MSSRAALVLALNFMGQPTGDSEVPNRKDAAFGQFRRQKRAPVAQATGAFKGRCRLTGGRSRSSERSRDRHTVIVVERAGRADIAPVPVSLIAIFRGAAKLVLGDAGAIATEAGVIFQRLPGQGIVVVSDTEEAAEAQHGVRHPAA